MKLPENVELIGDSDLLITSVTLPTKIEEEVRRAVSSWLPYINIQEVNTLTDDGDENKIFVEVKYSTVLNQQTSESITLDAGYTVERV